MKIRIEEGARVSFKCNFALWNSVKKHGPGESEDAPGKKDLASRKCFHKLSTDPDYARVNSKSCASGNIKKGIKVQTDIIKPKTYIACVLLNVLDFSLTKTYYFWEQKV